MPEIKFDISSQHFQVLFYVIQNNVIFVCVCVCVCVCVVANKWLNGISEIMQDIKRHHAIQENSSTC